MSRVTINDSAWDYRHTATCEDIVSSADIEIVPRKIVEMIIEKCEKDGATYLGAVGNEALDIKEYALSLLAQFEKDDSSNTEKCSEEPLPFD